MTGSFQGHTVTTNATMAVTNTLKHVHILLRLQYETYFFGLNYGLSGVTTDHGDESLPDLLKSSVKFHNHLT